MSAERLYELAPLVVAVAGVFLAVRVLLLLLRAAVMAVMQWRYPLPADKRPALVDENWLEWVIAAAVMALASIPVLLNFLDGVRTW